MKKAILALIALLLTCTVYGQGQIRIVSDSKGSRLTVDGTPLFLNGMNWDYFPIGTNYAYSLWTQPDDVIKAALENEMSLLKSMGVNVIRQYATVPPRWIEYIYRQYGIYTMINHSFGRYGLVVDGVDKSHTDYCDKGVRKQLLSEVEEFVNTYKDTPGVLFYLLGNENNYGLFWSGAETEDIPVNGNLPDAKARGLYRLFNEAAQRVKSIDAAHPVAICNGDLMYIDIIAEECKDIDILGVNSYRGDSFDVLFKDVRKKFGKPVVLTEFGADAFNAVTKREAQMEQAEILLNNWREIYLNAAGMGRQGNCLGGFTFQFSDGWWKSGQTTGLDVHDTSASWANGGYRFDYVKGKNNMNEEWFGICGKGKPDSKGLYELQPRIACQMLAEVHRITPYRSTPSNVKKQFKDIKKRIRNKTNNK